MREGSRSAPIAFAQRSGELLLRDAQGERPVRLAWARPLSGWGKEIAVLGMDGRELLHIPDPSRLDPASREIALAHLRHRYFVPRILGIHRIEAVFGHRYWHVRTDRGDCRFIVRDPAADILPAGEGGWLIKDSHGNRYAIPDPGALDAASRRRFETSR
jgi:hypothetical protein